MGILTGMPLPGMASASTGILPDAGRFERIEYLLDKLGGPPFQFWLYVAFILCLVLMMVAERNRLRQEPKTLESNSSYDSVYLSALDGIRAIALVLIFIFHNWQQSWIDFDIRIGDFYFPLGNLQRYGFLAVEIFFVLSGFCLFYPIARHMMEGAKDFHWKDFYIKRLRRILPAYLLVILAIFVFPVLSGNMNPVVSPEQYFKNLLANLTFTQNFYTPAEGAFSSTAWTLTIEVQFYLLVPLIVRFFKKHPWATCGVLCVIGWCSRFWFMTGPTYTMADKLFPISYFDVFAAGMLAAYLLVYLRTHYDKEKLRIYMTAISLFCIPLIWQFFMWLGTARVPDADTSAYWQTMFRFPFAVVTGLWIVSTCMASGWLSKRVYGNKLMVYLSTISYSFFLWHQNIHIMLKRLNLAGASTPRPMDDRPAMQIYILLSIVFSLAIATLSTYLIERPIVKYGYKGSVKKLFSLGKKEKALNKEKGGKSC